MYFEYIRNLYKNSHVVILKLDQNVSNQNFLKKNVFDKEGIYFFAVTSPNTLKTSNNMPKTLFLH